MPDSQVIHIETGDEEASDRSDVAQVLQAEPVQLPETRPMPADPFDDLQPMLDLRFPEEPEDVVTASANDEIIVLPDDTEAARVMLLSDDTTAPEETPVEAFWEPVEETGVPDARQSPCRHKASRCRLTLPTPRRRTSRTAIGTPIRKSQTRPTPRHRRWRL
jgi:hypothetical protein